MAVKPLFRIPIDHETAGTIVCTTTSSIPSIYILTINFPPDNRLITPSCQALLLALDILEISYPPGVVVTTSSLPKFFSNGTDLEHAFGVSGFIKNTFYALFRRLLTYPMPTIALINGHAFAGGFLLAMYHDYRVFNHPRGLLCLNELDLGVALKPAMSSILKQKLSAETYRTVVLEAARFTGANALKHGIVDAVGGWDDVEKFIIGRNLLSKGRSGIYGAMKMEMYKETIALLNSHDRQEVRQKEEIESDAERKEAAVNRVETWRGRFLNGKL